VFGATAFAELHDVLLHNLLEVVATARLVYGIDALWVVYVLNQVLQLTGRIPWQPRETRFLPEAGQKVEIVRIFMAVAAGANRPHGVPRHDMERKQVWELIEER